ncbi:MAG TPA: DUF4118 domain-containing protein, partial [Rugosimonospora sp.]|nr:DUF4118 domain-containing protein [Rugosimonospora sp.]
MTTLLTQPRSQVRLWLGVALGGAGLAVVTVALAPHKSLTSAALLYLVPVVAVAAIGGVRLGLAVAVASDLLLNWFFVPPYHTLAVERRDNLLALLVYVLVAVSVSLAVDLAARQRAAAVRSGIEARLLARITAAPVAEQSLTQLLGHVRDTFGMSWVALLDGTEPVAEVGTRDAEPPVLSVPAAPGLQLVATGPEVFGEDRR